MGIGTFAVAPIKKDEVVIVQGGDILPSSRFLQPGVEEIAEFAFQIEKDFCICPEKLDKKNRDGIMFVNHSCEPNCGMRGQIVLVAMRDIPAGEQITFDYSMTDANAQKTWVTIDCLCGEPTCRKQITDQDWKRKDLQEKYHGYFSDYIQRMIDAQTT